MSVEESEKLQKLVNDLKKNRLEDRIALTYSRTEDTRSNARESLLQAFLLAQAEAGKFESDQHYESPGNILVNARTLAKEIEAPLFIKHQKVITRDYVKQFRQLHSALIH